MPASAVVLQSLRLGALQPREATLLQLRCAQVVPGGPAVAVTLQTPLGTVELATA
jgi:hypothetical protein